MENDSVSTLIHDLFKEIFHENCEIDEEDVTSEEETTLNELSAYEAFQNFKDLVHDLLNFKRKTKKTEKGDLVSQCEQLEMMLQKLEGEARAHYGIEHQLKIHVDSCQGKIEELEKVIAAYSSLIEKQASKIKENEIEIRALQKQKDVKTESIELKLKIIEKRFKDEIASLVEQHKAGETARDYDLTAFKTFDNKTILRAEKSTLRFDEYVKLKMMLEGKSKQLEILQVKYNKAKSEEKTSTVERKARTKRLDIESKLVDIKNQRQTHRERGIMRNSATDLLEILRKNDMKSKQRYLHDKRRDTSNLLKNQELIHIRSISDQIRSDSMTKSIKVPMKLHNN